MLYCNQSPIVWALGIAKCLAAVCGRNFQCAALAPHAAPWLRLCSQCMDKDSLSVEENHSRVTTTLRSVKQPK